MAGARHFYSFDRFKPDAGQVSDAGIDYAENALYIDGQWQGLPQVTAIFSGGGSASQVCHGLVETNDENGERIAFGSASRLFSVDPAGTFFTDISRAGNYTNAAMWGFARFGSKLIYCCGPNPVGLVNFGGASTDVIASATKWQFKHIMTVRSHVIGCNVVAPAPNPRQFVWCDKNDETVWEAGTGRAGFAFIQGEMGVISGCFGFVDFGLIFTTTGVYRLSYIGEGGMWDLQQIAGMHDGMLETCGRTPCAVGRDVYYLGRSGPKVVVNGEAVRDLANAEMRRALVDIDVSTEASRAWSPYAFAGNVWGASDSLRRVVAFSGISGASVTIGSTVLYSIDDESWAVWYPNVVATGSNATVQVAMASRIAAIGPGSPLMKGLLFGWNASGLHLSAVNSATTGLMAHKFRSKAWAVPGALRTKIYGIRPFWRRPSNGSSGTLSLPEITIDGLGFRDPGQWAVATQESFSTTSAAANVNPTTGFIEGAFPKSANFWQFTVTVPATDPLDYRDLIGLEILAEAAT